MVLGEGEGEKARQALFFFFIIVTGFITYLRYLSLSAIARPLFLVGQGLILSSHFRPARAPIEVRHSHTFEKH